MYCQICRKPIENESFWNSNSGVPEFKFPIHNSCANEKYPEVIERTRHNCWRCKNCKQIFYLPNGPKHDTCNTEKQTKLNV